MDATKALPIQPPLFEYLFFTSQASTINVMNNKPCMLPAMVTATGIFAKYFSGMAMPNKTRNEIPSAIAAILNQWNIFVDFIMRKGSW